MVSSLNVYLDPIEDVTNSAEIVVVFSMVYLEERYDLEHGIDQNLTSLKYTVRKIL